MLLDAVKSVLHTDVLAAMAAQSRSLGKPEALSLITQNILQLLEE